MIENWATAVRDRDLDGILAYHSDDVIMFDVPPPFQSTGLEAYRHTWSNFFDYTQAGIFDIGELKIVADENVAFAYASMKCSDKSDTGDYEDLPFRLTIGLKKNNGQWTFVHEHHSIPAK